MALSSPIGSATTIAIRETSVVPATSGRTPKLGLEKSGVHSVPNRKSAIGTSLRKAVVSTASTAMMPIVVPTESRAQRKSAHSIRNSKRFMAAGLFFSSEQLLQRHPDLRTAGSERRADFVRVEMGLGQSIELGCQLDIPHLAHQTGRREVGIDKCAHFRTIGRLARHVDEERTRQR